ncbi:MAG: glycosyltransferase [Candidatus Bathyarchaeia archaeon]|jgi:glycosyltransferase involved in cell wall biosynthesis
METLRFVFTTTFYPPYHLGGDAVHVKYLAEELAKNGHEVHVFHSLDAFKLKKRVFPEEKEQSGVQRHPLRTPFGVSSYSAYLFGNSSLVTRRFKSLIDKVKPDIVHHHNISLLGYDILKKQREYVNIYTCHDNWLVCQQNILLKNGKTPCQSRACFSCSIRCRRPPQIWRHRKAFDNAIKELDLMIAPSSFVSDRISEKIRLKTVIIPNFVPKPPSEIGQSGFSNYFLYAGALEKHKGVIDLVNVFKDLETDAKLLIAGSGSLRPKIEKFTKMNNLAGKIVLLGWVDSNPMYQLLKNANALLIPSVCPENCPMIVLEALSVGTPAVGSNIGGLPEILNKVSTNLLFNNLCELKNILSGFSKYDYSSSKIRNIYERYFSPKAYIAKYFEAIAAIRND